MKSSAALKSADVPFALRKADPTRPVLAVTGRTTLAILAGTTLAIGAALHVFDTDTAVAFAVDLAQPGCDFEVFVYPDSLAVAFPAGTTPDIEGGMVFAGFHYAPGGNAEARSGGDDLPAINPFSCWDLNFRPVCADPRGLRLVSTPDGKSHWRAIYLLGINHHVDGPSRFAAIIADGAERPFQPDGSGKYPKLDYDTAGKIAAHHGMRLPTYQEHVAGAYGVTERSSVDGEPERTGLDAPRTSSTGGMQESGNMWIWGTDGDPDDPRPSIFGGSWISGRNAGSRYAALDYWPENSLDDFGVRLCCDHLMLE